MLSIMRRSTSASHAGARPDLLLMKSREVMGVHGPAALVRIQRAVAKDTPLPRVAPGLSPRQARPEQRHATLTNRHRCVRPSTRRQRTVTQSPQRRVRSGRCRGAVVARLGQAAIVDPAIIMAAARRMHFIIVAPRGEHGKISTSSVRAFQPVRRRPHDPRRIASAPNASPRSARSSSPSRSCWPSVRARTRCASSPSMLSQASAAITTR